MLFGHQNDDTKPADNVISNDTGSVNPLAVDPATGASLPVVPEDLEHADDSTGGSTPAFNQPDLDLPSTPPADDQVVQPDVSEEPAPAPAEDPDADLLSPQSGDELLNLKQQALQQLSPLVDHLEQSPEEKFRTTMMMIQSSDNQALIKNAYEAAQQIPDDKVRAQALLDVVNEINYFTQNAVNK